MVNITLDADKCEGCGTCADSCPVSIYSMDGGKVKITGDVNECVVCRTCEESCPTQAIKVAE